MLRRAALLWLLPSVSLAQTAAIGQVVIAESADADLYVNLDECTGKTADNLTLTWQVASAGVVPTVPSGTTVSLTISKDASCPPAGTATVWQPATAPDAAGSASGGYPPTGGSLPVTTVLTALGLNTCPSQQTPLNACAAMTISGTTYTATGSITFDTQLPPAPTLGGVEPGDSALIVSYTAGISGGSTPAASDHYQAQATGPDGLVHLSSSTTATSARIEGLANGETYDVVVYAYNKAGNQSAASNTVAGSPEPVIDFWQAYKSGGGREQGGCGAGSAGDVAPILAASALALALRRRLS